VRKKILSGLTVHHLGLFILGLLLVSILLLGGLTLLILDIFIIDIHSFVNLSAQSSFIGRAMKGLVNKYHRRV
jgi:hypothetical protein